MVTTTTTATKAYKSFSMNIVYRMGFSHAHGNAATRCAHATARACTALVPLPNYCLVCLREHKRWFSITTACRAPASNTSPKTTRSGWTGPGWRRRPLFPRRSAAWLSETGTARGRLKSSEDVEIPLDCLSLPSVVCRTSASVMSRR